MRYAITFGEVSILHIRVEERRKIKDRGFSVEQLREINNIDKDMGKPPGVSSELYTLSDVLVIHNTATYLLKDHNCVDELYTGQKTVEYHMMFYVPRKKKMNHMKNI